MRSDGRSVHRRARPRAGAGLARRHSAPTRNGCGSALVSRSSPGWAETRQGLGGAKRSRAVVPAGRETPSRFFSAAPVRSAYVAGRVRPEARDNIDLQASIVPARPRTLPRLPAYRRHRSPAYRRRGDTLLRPCRADERQRQLDGVEIVDVRERAVLVEPELPGDVGREFQVALVIVVERLGAR